MYLVFWRSVFYFFLFFCGLTFLNLETDAALEGSAMGYLGLPYSPDTAVFSRIRGVFEAKVSHEGQGGLIRRKRNILFPSGVKLCAQETAQQVVANHLSYFHLRVCQETIWEAFKIFWDRLPDQEEYQTWMQHCQEGVVTAKEVGSHFSQSEEHQALVKKRMSMPGMKSEPARAWQHMCSTAFPHIQEGVTAPEPGEGEAAIVPDVELDNDISVATAAPPVLEQVVELSILLTGETYTEDLEDPASLAYQTLSAQLSAKIEDALQRLPGFKSVSVLDFRSVSIQASEGNPGTIRVLPRAKKLLRQVVITAGVFYFEVNKGLEGIMVDYAVKVTVDGTGVSNEQLDYLTLQSNQVENSYRQVKEPPTAVYTINELKTFATEALHNSMLETVTGDSMVTYSTFTATVSEIPESVDAAGEATVNFADEPSDILVLVKDLEDVKTDEFLLKAADSKSMATTESDVIVLEESIGISSALIPTTATPESGSLTEEGLLVEDTLDSTAVEEPIKEELLPELLLPDMQEILTLPKPPVETEASGSGTGDVNDSLWLATSTPAATARTAGDEVGSLESTSKNVVITENLSKDAVDVALLDELNEAEISEELHISSTGTVSPDDLPAVVSAPNTETIASEESQSEAEQTPSLSGGNNSVEGATKNSNPSDIPAENQDLSPEQAEKDTVIDTILTHSEETILEDGGFEETTNSVRQDVKENTTPEAPAVVGETPQSSEITTDDLAEEEILLVNQNGPEPAVTVHLSPVEPTALSPERESPFTLISDMNPATEGQPDLIIPSQEIQPTSEASDDASIEDHGIDVFHFGYGLINHTEEGSTGFPFGISHGTDQASIAMPANPGRALMVFFSLRVTNMIFSEDLFNKSSPEYKALEQRFLELLVPYLQSNLSNFENLEILNFRNGSIVVNSRMKFGKPVAQGVTTTVYLILEDFCNTAYQTMNLAIDKYSLDVESGDQADPCKFQACNEYAECKVNKWSGEAECVCNAGYFSVDGLPCQSICELQTDFCLNDGKCDIIPGQGAICRCRVGENWWYRGEHCEEFVSEPLVVGIAVASVAGFLLVASGVIFFLARTLRDQYEKDESEDPIRRGESLPSLERATKYNPMYESEATTGYSHYYRRYPEVPVYSSASAEASTDFSSEEIRHIYENSELTKEEIQDRIRIIELYTKDRQFADFVRQHQAVLDTRRESSSAQT